MRLKFWDKSQSEKPGIPDDSKDFFADREGAFPSNVQQGHVPASPGVKSVVVTATIITIVIVVGFLWLYFHQFLFSNDT
ncbi:MAG TPA: hypothetical protein VJ843_05915 [Candidatus Saccharimonadales bacterium]|nr:hypothetical protein [Candidatus Saccharimonadales bacterium]